MEYSSRWNNPAHAVNQGSGITGVLSGGHLGRTARKERRRERLGRPKVEGKGTKRTGPLRSAKRKLHEVSVLIWMWLLENSMANEMLVECAVFDGCEYA
jgi:hypothetical protein